MSRFESGVARYLKGTAAVTVYFPVDFRGNATICCTACDLYSRTSGRCYLTHEIVPYPDKYVGGRCPLELEVDDEGYTPADGG